MKRAGAGPAPALATTSGGSPVELPAAVHRDLVAYAAALAAETGGQPAAPEKLAPFAVTEARVRMLLDHDRLADLPRLAAPALVIADSAPDAVLDQMLAFVEQVRATAGGVQAGEIHDGDTVHVGHSGDEDGLVLY